MGAFIAPKNAKLYNLYQEEFAVFNKTTRKLSNHRPRNLP